MTISLTHAEECLSGQTPKEYLAQLAVASHGIRQAKLAGKTTVGRPGSDLDTLRSLLEPDEVPA